MQITKEGRRLVASEEFALLIRDAMASVHNEGTPADQGTAYGCALIAWAMTGHDVNHPPQSADDLLALTNFIKAHAEEVNAAADACLEMLVSHDSKQGPWGKA